MATLVRLSGNPNGPAPERGEPPGSRGKSRPKADRRGARREGLSIFALVALVLLALGLLLYQLFPRAPAEAPAAAGNPAEEVQDENVEAYRARMRGAGAGTGGY